MPFGWFAPSKSTRAWEPTLSWNQLRSLTGVLSADAFVANSYGHLQTRVAAGKVCPRMVLVLLIVAGVGVAFRQVASPWVGA